MSQQTPTFYEFWDAEIQPGQDVAQARSVILNALKHVARAAYQLAAANEHHDFETWFNVATEDGPVAYALQNVDKNLRRVAFAAWLDGEVRRRLARVAPLPRKDNTVAAAVTAIGHALASMPGPAASYEDRNRWHNEQLPAAITAALALEGA